MTSVDPHGIDHGIDHDIVGFDTDEGAYPFYARIREQEPLFWSGRLQRWLLTRHDDVLTAYRNSAVFSSRTFASRGAGSALGEPAQDRVVETFTQQILFLDRPEHTRLRRLVSRAFTSRSVAQMRDYTASLTRSMLDGLRGGEFDFVDRFAAPLPLLVVSEILGVDVGDRDLYRAWSSSLTVVTSPTQPTDALRAAFRHVDEMRAFLEQLIEQRRASLRDDLLSRLIEVDDGGDRLTTNEIVAMVMIITAAGHETTTSLLVNALRLLLAEPERGARIGADDAFRKTAVEETLRWEPPLQFSTRVTTEDVELHGRVLPAGSAVALVPAAANRDPRVFASPERFDPARPGNPHVTFGNGPHACLGANLARVEADVAVAIIAREFPSLRLGSNLVRKPSPLFRGFDSASAGWE